MIGPSAAESPEELILMGFGSAPAQEPIRYLDPLPEKERGPGEHEEGVPVFWHPDIALALRFSHLANVIDRFRIGAWRELDDGLLEKLSNFEVEALLELAAAYSRAEIRSLRAEAEAS